MSLIELNNVALISVIIEILTVFLIIYHTIFGCPFYKYYLFLIYLDMIHCFNLFLIVVLLFNVLRSFGSKLNNLTALV